MKLSVALLALVPALASAARKGGRRMAKKAADTIPLEGRSIKADSKMGNKIMSSARKLENNNDNVDEFEWVVGYEIKFQGCHHVQQWNEEADGEDEPKIQTKRLVRFRLCPAGSCSASNAGGCDSGYGDYIIDLNLFLMAYWEDRMEQQEWDCEYAENNVCYDCENANNQEYCQYDCYNDNGYSFCNEENPYEQDDGQEQVEFEIDQYMECAQWDLPDNNNRRELSAAMKRKLEDEVQYFIGPYCSDQGGSVHLGVFTDEFCTNFADSEYDGYDHKGFYYKMVGEALPYAETSLVGDECLSCKEREEVPDNQNNDGNNNNNNNDAQDEDEVIELCEQLYAQAGKCESNLSPNSYYFRANENGCNYMDGIQIMRTDGTVVVKNAGSNKTAAAFIGIFAVAFVLLGAYVYYLKTKLDRAKVDLSGQ